MFKLHNNINYEHTFYSEQKLHVTAYCGSCLNVTAYCSSCLTCNSLLQQMSHM
jgi:hypothetical protein